MSLSAEQIAEKYYHDVYKFCCSRCRNADAAQDITQETFLFLINKIVGLTENNIRSWLFSVANNKLYEYFRTINIENNYVCADDVDVPVDNGFDVDEKDIDVDEIFDDVQKKILNILNDKEKALFIKLYIEKKEVNLITKEMDITYDNFRKRKSRLKRKVAKSVRYLYFFALVFSFKIFH